MANSKSQVWLTRIPKGHELWEGKYGLSASTVVREKEQPAKAAVRALQDELGLVLEKPTLIGFPEKMFTINDMKLFISYFIYRTNQDVKPNKQRSGEGQWVKVKHIDALLQSKQEEFSPTFYLAWKRCRDQL